MLLIATTNGLKISRFLIIITIICMESDFCVSWDIGSPHQRNRQCAQIFFQSSFKGRSFLLKDEEQVSDLSEIHSYFHKSTQHNVQFSGNETVNYSFSVRSRCKLQVSPLPYLKGQVHEFLGDVESVQDWFLPKSVACRCPKVCQCEAVKLGQNECGRAYFRGDCVECNAVYTSLKPQQATNQGSNNNDIILGNNGHLEGWNTFPGKWSSQVKTLLLRQGCNATLRFLKSGQNIPAEAPLPVFAFTSFHVTKNVSASGDLTHFICQCPAASEKIRTLGLDIAPDDSMYKYPPLVTIPRTRGGINMLLSSREDLMDHPGLLASLQSLRSRKSSKNAYILLLGMSGSGKSSTVNLLFDHPNITKVGDYMSTTKDILEFTIPVPVPQLGMNNTALHVIDTPGIGDTRGVTQDATFLASVDHLFSTHIDLRQSLPNVILIFAKFSDNRYSGEASAFVKMLRTIDLFKDRLIDKRSTNVVFVLTHYMSETREMTRDPSQRIAGIRRVIHEYSSLPRPIHIVVAENKPEQAQLPNVNGFWSLPNGEFYPKNLFDQIQRNLIKSQDPVGEVVIRTAFSSSDVFKIQAKSYPLLSPTNENVIRYLGILSTFYKAADKTQVSIALQEAYEHLDPKLKREYPNSLKTLKRNLYNKHIWHESDVPKTCIGILKLMEEIEINPANLFLLENAFNVTIPEFPVDFIVGSGYSLTRDTVLPSQIFKHDENIVNQMSEDFLFKVPELYQVSLDHDIDTQFQVVTSRDEFIKSRINSLGLSEPNAWMMVKDVYNASTTHVFPGFNLISLSDGVDTTWNSLTATVNYHTFQISLSPTAKLSEEFASSLSSLKPLNLTDELNVKNWQGFFEKYGTHVVTNAFGGGTIKIKAEMTKNKSRVTNGEKMTILSETLANITRQLGNELIGKDEIFYRPPAELINYRLSQSGGSDKHYWSNFAELDETRNVEAWRDSVKYEPVILTSRLQVLPISKIVKDYLGEDGQVKGEMIETTAASLLNCSLVFIPVESTHNTDSPETREQTHVDDESDYQKMQEFSAMFRIMSEMNVAAENNLLNVLRQLETKLQVEEKQWEKRMRDAEQEGLKRERSLEEAHRQDAQLQQKREQLEIQRLAQNRILREEMEAARQQTELEQWTKMQDIQSKNTLNLLAFVNGENARRDALIRSKNKDKWHYELRWT